MDDLFHRIDKVSTLDFGDILSKSFELFKKVWVQALLTGIVSILVALPFMLVMFLFFVPYYMEAFSSGGDPDILENVPFMVILGWMAVMVVLSFLLQPFILSIHGNFLHICKNADHGDSADGPGYFYLVKTHFVKLLLLSLTTIGIALLAMLLCYLPIFYVLVPIQMFLPILVFNEDLSVSEVVKLSFKVGNKFWLIIFGLIIVSGLLASITGLLLCGIGAIVTSFYQNIVVYHIYKDSIGFEDQ